METRRLSLEEIKALEGFYQPEEQTSATLRTHRLKQIGDLRVELVPTVAAFVLSGALLACGAGLGLFGVWSDGWGAMLGRFALGAVFFWWGTVQLRSALRPIVFDKSEGLFWTGRRPVAQAYPLADVVAVQLLTCPFKRRPPEHELNLVLASGKRVHVVDQGNEIAMGSDAASLAEFLGVPLLEADVELDDGKGDDDKGDAGKGDAEAAA